MFRSIPPPPLSFSCHLRPDSPLHRGLRCLLFLRPTQPGSLETADLSVPDEAGSGVLLSFVSMQVSSSCTQPNRLFSSRPDMVRMYASNQTCPRKATTLDNNQMPQYGLWRERQDSKFILNWQIMDVASFPCSCTQMLRTHKLRLNVTQRS